ncbi:hypothetical protein BS17DRAFT_853965, partial [Gyrodon lividus]
HLSIITLPSLPTTARTSLHGWENEEGTLHSRTFSFISTTTYLLVVMEWYTRVMNTTSQMKTGDASIFKMTKCFFTACYESTIQHTTYNVNKIQLIPSPEPTSWCCCM